MAKYEGVIIRDRETLRGLIQEAGCDTLDEIGLPEVNDDEGLSICELLAIMSRNIEYKIMPKGMEINAK